ncbi:broad substrate specificity ATP-binding cassette transporter ABCG2-like, partial [Pseudochaenichthys georgianus]|uniref:broad substrate specificity ATP-binding cassette transporter ABCG2-like n=1 Tax=Pseudochaenichthys georgianus TaxID=52239 RepID=UPI0039C3D892
MTSSSQEEVKMSEGRVAIDMATNGASRHQPAGLGQQLRGATVSFHNIVYKVTVGGNCLCRKKGTIKEILIDLNGLMKPGLNAIMGATGSGKSSFLDVLAARKDPAGLSGEVLIDGAHQPPNFKCLSGYVVQVRGGQTGSRTAGANQVRGGQTGSRTAGANQVREGQTGSRTAGANQ